MKKCKYCPREQKYLTRGMCGGCYSNWLKYGKFRPYYRKNQIIIKDDYAVLVTRYRDYSVSGRFIIDKEDVEKISIYKWGLHKGGYCSHKGKIMLHQAILGGQKKGLVIDHINNDRNDNRKINLRYVEQRFNKINSIRRCKGYSKYKGVRYKKDKDRWYAVITVKGKRHSKHGFKTEKEAALAYNKMAQKFYPEYCRLNDIDF